MTYLFDMNIDYEFFASSHLTALVRRMDVAQAGDYNYDPMRCLLDHHCAEAEIVGKNQLNLDVILTTGEYELIIFVNQPGDVDKFLMQDAGLRELPMSFSLTATPVVQNEDR